ncbi:Proton channel OtopLc, partial [Frankliniella fusca]
MDGDDDESPLERLLVAGSADDSSGSEQHAQHAQHPQAVPEALPLPLPLPRAPSRTLPRRQAGFPRLDPVWEPIRDSFTSLTSRAEPSPGDGRGRSTERHLIFLEPPDDAHRMDRRGWRRPSAPSIFQHIESALGRRPSATPPTVTVVPAGASGPPPPLQPASILRSTGSLAQSQQAQSQAQHAQQAALDVMPHAAHTMNTVALRRPSAVVLMLMDSPDPDRANSFTPLSLSDEYLKVTPKFDDTITVYLSAMYAKLLVTLGIAFPILETIYEDGKYYQGFYLYLYIGTFVFLSFMYGNVLKKRAVVFVVNTYRRKGSQPRPSIDSTLSGIARPGPRKHYGSFYLRLGAI